MSHSNKSFAVKKTWWKSGNISVFSVFAPISKSSSTWKSAETQKIQKYFQISTKKKKKRLVPEESEQEWKLD